MADLHRHYQIISLAPGSSNETCALTWRGHKLGIERSNPLDPFQHWAPTFWTSHDETRQDAGIAFAVPGEHLAIYGDSNDVLRLATFFSVTRPHRFIFLVEHFSKEFHLRMSGSEKVMDAIAAEPGGEARLILSDKLPQHPNQLWHFQNVEV